MEPEGTDTVRRVCMASNWPMAGGSEMKIGSLVKRKPAFGEWVKMNPWMTTAKDLETGIILRIGRSYEVLWQGEYTETHDETELLEVQ